MCGNPAPSSCSRCHSRRYCSKLHQLYDWKQGKHKSSCVAVAKGAAASSSSSSSSAAAPPVPAPAPSNSLLFPQKEVVIEPENSDSESDTDDDDESEDDDKQPRAAASSSASSGSGSSKDGGAAKPKDKTNQKKQKKSKSGGGGGGAGGDDYSKERRLLEDYEKAKASEAAAGEVDDEEDEQELSDTVSNWASPKLKDPLFNKFKERTSRHPDQILRYDRAPGNKAHTQPLWVSTWYQPGSPPMPPVVVAAPGAKPSPGPRPLAPTAAANDAAVPACSACGAPRRFEFQVLPQLLYYLGPNGAALDFANLAVYTCANSCGDGVTEGYTEEFVWVQAHAQ